jgi:hypothetical protein
MYSTTWKNTVVLFTSYYLSLRLIVRTGGKCQSLLSAPLTQPENSYGDFFSLYLLVVYNIRGMIGMIGFHVRLVTARAIIDHGTCSTPAVEFAWCGFLLLLQAMHVTCFVWGFGIIDFTEATLIISIAMKSRIKKITEEVKIEKWLFINHIIMAPMCHQAVPSHTARRVFVFLVDPGCKKELI